MAKERHYKQGFFRPKHPEKYKGDVQNIVYRSGWEKRCMSYLDENTNVTKWSSEEVIIPYVSPVDGKRHRYFPDFWIETIEKKVFVWEIKPAAQTQEPKRKTKKTKQYINEIVTWGINSNKWKAAEEYCKDRGWEFKVITEKELFGKRTK